MPQGSKIVKHTERMEIPGWEFISQFASKGKSDEGESDSFKSRQIPEISRYMDDVIAGRPIFGEPGEPGGFRLRYGRSRATGLARWFESSIDGGGRWFPIGWNTDED